MQAFEDPFVVVAEGVEDAETAAVLREYGCTVVQGYYYSEPMAAAEMPAFLGSTTAAPAAARSSDAIALVGRLPLSKHFFLPRSAARSSGDVASLTLVSRFYLPAFATAVAGVCAAWLVGGWGGEQTRGMVGAFAVFGFALFATICAGLRAAASSGRKRAAWICMAVGLAGYALGEALWAYFDLVLHVDPFPSVADIAYLIYPVGACLALVLYPVGYSGQSRVRILLDGVIVAGALFAVSWLLVLRSVYETGGATNFAIALSSAYPGTDIVVVTVALLVLVRARPGERVALALLTSGNVMNALADSIWVYLNAENAYQNGNFVDLLWMAGLLLIGLAALAGRRATPAEERVPKTPSRAQMWMPYLPIAAAAVVGAPVIGAVPGLKPLIISSCVLVAAVVARQVLVMGDNRKLLHTVAAQAFRDPLTGLANRALFNDRLTHAVQLHERDQQSVAVLSLDLDDFKLVNDSMGHPAGDALLVMVAHRLVGCVRTSDTVARLGGDEFAVLMEGEPDHARLISHRVAQAFDNPFYIDSRELLIHPSAGLAVAGADELDVSAEILLKQADVALYSAKRSRTGGVHMFTPDMQLIEPKELDLATDAAGAVGSGAAAVQLLGELRRAIDNLDLRLVYQPKVDLRDEQIVGVEALVRWPHADRGLLGPESFLPLVRKHGLMRSVTELVLHEALDDVAGWSAEGFTMPVAVNLFAPSLEDLELPRQLERALHQHDMARKMLTVEITEDLLLNNLDRTRTVLSRLRDSGVRVAIDDFGSGYSALSYLRELPVDELKLDHQFVATILVNQRAAAIARAVIDLAHGLGVVPVAEGVEDAATAAMLLEYGCHIAQGFYYSRPLPGPAMLELLAARDGLTSATAAPAAARSS